MFYTIYFFQYYLIINHQKFTEKFVLKIARPVARGGWGGYSPPVFSRTVKPISTRGSRLCPPQYYEPPRIFRPCDGPVVEYVRRALMSSTYTAERLSDISSKTNDKWLLTLTPKTTPTIVVQISFSQNHPNLSLMSGSNRLGKLCAHCVSGVQIMCTILVPYQTSGSFSPLFWAGWVR